MKKLLKLSLISLLIISLMIVVTGCGEKKEKNNNNNTNVIQEDQSKDNGKSKTYNLFNKVFSGGNYMMILEGETDLGEGLEKATITMAVKGNNTCVDVSATSQHVTIIYKDDASYIISHDEKMYMAMAGEQDYTLDDMTLITDEDLKTMETQEYKTGKETIDGTEYEYEEYKDEENGTAERYYFSGNDLKYMKSIDEDGKEEIMKTIKLSSEVDESIFSIPADYQEVDMSTIE